MSETTNSTIVEKRFFEVLGKTPKSIAYIPSKTDPQRLYFSRFQKNFNSLGVANFQYCDFDQEIAASSWDTLDSSSGVYLSGGFTPAFLESLKSKGVLAALASFSKTKPVVGVSAGALIMGQNISILNDDPCEGEASRALGAMEGLKLYSWDFWPHFGKNKADSERLKARSLNLNKTILSCDDFSGLILNDGKVRAVGTAHVFRNGTHQIFKDQEVDL